MDVTFITGNPNKAEYLSKLIGLPISHQKIDLEEIQSLKLEEIVEHKLRQAYAIVQKPIIVEDASLEFEALGGLPGTFIKFFVDNTDEQVICDMVKGRSRRAWAKSIYGYYDGEHMEFFEGCLEGTIAQTPEGENGYGYDRFFVPAGYDVPRAALSPEDDEKTYLQIKPLDKVKEFLTRNTQS